MTTVRVRLHVDEQGHVTGQVVPTVPPGDYTAALVLPPAERPAEAPAQLDWPVHDSGPWPADLSLRREDLYGDDGR
jgi:hypothetical protein